MSGTEGWGLRWKRPDGAQRYLAVCREVHHLLPEEDAWSLLRAYGPLAKTSVAQVERAWAREKHRRGLA